MLPEPDLHVYRVRAALEGRCNACLSEPLADPEVNAVRVGFMVIRLCPSCSRRLVDLLQAQPGTMSARNTKG